MLSDVKYLFTAGDRWGNDGPPLTVLEAIILPATLNMLALKASELCNGCTIKLVPSNSVNCVSGERRDLRSRVKYYHLPGPPPSTPASPSNRTTTGLLMS